MSGRFKPIKGSSSEIDAIPIIEGQFLVKTDTGKAFVDTSGLTRVAIGDGSGMEFYTVADYTAMQYMLLDKTGVKNAYYHFVEPHQNVDLSFFNDSIIETGSHVVFCTSGELYCSGSRIYEEIQPTAGFRMVDMRRSDSYPYVTIQVTEFSEAYSDGWFRILSNNGSSGESTPGLPGANGQSAYVHVRWGATATPDPLLTTPSDYMGICSSTLATAPTGYASYQWAKVGGDSETVFERAVSGDFYLGTLPLPPEGKVHTYLFSLEQNSRLIFPIDTLGQNIPCEYIVNSSGNTITWVEISIRCIGGSNAIWLRSELTGH